MNSANYKALKRTQRKYVPSAKIFYPKAKYAIY